MKKEDIEKYSVTVTGLNESDMGTKEALEAGYITQTGFAESINSTTSGETEDHVRGSETNPTTTTIGGTQFPNDKSVFVANASAASSMIDALTAKDLDLLVSLYKLDQESSWPSATDWKKMNVSTKRSTVKSALDFA